MGELCTEVSGWEQGAGAFGACPWLGRFSGMAGINGGKESDGGEQASWLTFVVDEGWGFICINQ